MKNTAILSDEGGIGISWGSKSEPSHYNHSIDTTNTVNGKSVYYFYNKTNLILSNLDAGHVTFALCSNITLKNSNVTGGDGMLAAFSSNLNITNNNISSNLGTNIEMTTSSHYNNFTNNVILGAGAHGIRFYDSIENEFFNNTIKINSFSGIFVDRYSINNTISHCSISNNDRGLMVRGGYNTFTNNTITKNNMGVWLLFHESVNNIFFNNSLNNTGTEFYLDQGPNAYVINTSFNKSRVATREIDESYLVIQWFLHVNITDYLGNPIPNANVRVMDNDNGSFDQIYSSETDGFKRWIVVTEFWQNKTNKIHYTPHSSVIG
jgi:parallel beta-helix repeat protein